MKEKRLARFLLIFMLACTVIPTGQHVHDEHCGYNPETGTGCEYDISLFQIKDFGD